jgi:hypothetical protein
MGAVITVGKVRALNAGSRSRALHKIGPHVWRLNHAVAKSVDSKKNFSNMLRCLFIWPILS